MLDLRFLRTQADKVRKALKDRGANVDFDAFEALDARRREMVAEVETLKAERNKASGEVAKLKRSGGDATELLNRLAESGERVKALDAGVKELDAQLEAFRMSIPNTPHESVPVGASEADNPVVRSWGVQPGFSFAPKEHWEIGAGLGLLDFERAAKVAGARFAVSYGDLARLERALAAFMLDVHTREHGYLEVAPPYLVNDASLVGTGQLPKFAEDLFKIEGRELYLIPTAEVPVTNLHRDEALAEDDLPRAYCALTPCFRSEAGSYGRDVKGLIRQHQFHKVELVRFAHPERSFEDLELLTGHAEAILQRLGLHYRVIVLCTGDMGFSSAKTYDLEVWLPGQKAYREISSCSNFEDFQARRADIRFKPKGGNKTFLAHTLNGSGLAVGRTLVAVLENYQNEDGTVTVPEALVPYMGGQTVIQRMAR